jgi:phage-related protein
VARAIFHRRALEDIRAFPRKVRKAVGAAIWELQQGRRLALPMSRPMPSIAAGAHELRVREVQTSFRVVYCLRPDQGVLVLSAFVKKARSTPMTQVKLAQRRLRELAYEEN